jgi:hypothetical protein
MVEAPCIILHVKDHRAADAVEVEPAMLVEILVLGGEESADHEFRHRLDRQIKPALIGIFGEQRAVGRMHPRHHRRFIILELRVVRQILGKMPQKAGDGANADDEHYGSGREQKAEETQQELHRECPAPSGPILAPSRAARGNAADTHCGSSNPKPP